MPLDRYPANQLNLAMLRTHRPDARVVAYRQEKGPGHLPHGTGYARHAKCITDQIWGSQLHEQDELLVDEWDCADYDLGVSYMRACSECNQGRTPWP